MGRDDRRVDDPRRPEIDPPPLPTSPASTRTSAPAHHVEARTGERSTRPTGSSTRRAVGVRPKGARSRRCTPAKRGPRRVLLRGRRLGAADLVRVQPRVARRVRRPRHAARPRVGLPLVVADHHAEHLAMRDRAGIVDLSAFAIFDVVGPGALEAVQRIVVSAVRRADRPRHLHPGARRARRVPLRPHRHAARTRPVPGRHRRRARHGRPQVVRRPAAERRQAPVVDLTSAYTTVGLWVLPARDILSSILPPQRRQQRGFRVRCLSRDRGRLAGRPRVPHLVRRRARLGAVCPDRAERQGLGPAARGRPSSTAPPRSASACTARPAGSRRATARAALEAGRAADGRAGALADDPRAGGERRCRGGRGARGARVRARIHGALAVTGHDDRGRGGARSARDPRLDRASVRGLGRSRRARARLSSIGRA